MSCVFRRIVRLLYQLSTNISPAPQISFLFCFVLHLHFVCFIFSIMLFHFSTCSIHSSYTTTALIKGLLQLTCPIGLHMYMYTVHDAIFL